MPPAARFVLVPLAPPLCHACGSWAGRPEPLCSGCRSRLRWLGRHPVVLGPGLRAWAPLAYDGPARDLVHSLKFRGGAALAQPMAAQIAATAPAGLLEAAALVPVPLDPLRLGRRGFNQAERLAAELAAVCGLPVEDCLVRRRGRGRQVGRTRAERIRGPGTVVMREGAAAPRAAIVVDDVITTGATVAACAAVLRAAGARRVDAVAYSRTPARL